MKGLVTVLSLLVGFVFPTLASAKAPAVGEVCKMKIEAEAMFSENYFLAQFNTKIEQPDIYSYVNQRSDGTFAAHVWITDEFDGKSSIYIAENLSQSDVLTCKISLNRVAEGACRYGGSGEDDFLAKAGAVEISSRVIAPTSAMTNLEERQIIDFLTDDGRGDVRDVIGETDDGEVIQKVWTMPNGKILEYYKAYGGDNAFGVIYLQGTVEKIGYNSDGDICLGFEIEK